VTARMLGLWKRTLHFCDGADVTSFDAKIERFAAAFGVLLNDRPRRHPAPIRADFLSIAALMRPSSVSGVSAELRLWGDAMRLKIAALSAVSVAVMFFSMGVFARAADAVALKSGETVELGNLFWAANCRSLLKGAMTVEVLEGPPEVTASIREQKVIPHIQNCAKPVDGGILLLTAPKEIKERKQAKVILRVKYPTVDGERQKSHNIDLTLVP